MVPQPRNWMSRLDKRIERLQTEDPTCRISIVRSGGVGDTVLLLPTIQLLRQALPQAHLTLVGSSWARQLLPLMPQGLGFIQFDSTELTPLFFPDAGEDPAGVFAEADLVIIYTSREDGPLVRNARMLCDGTVRVWPVDPPAETHAACHFAAALLMDCPGLRDIPAPVLSVPSHCNSRNDVQGPTVAVHPGSGGRRKVWPSERFAELIRSLRQEDIRVFLPEGPADKASCSEVLEKLPDHRSLVSPEKLTLVDCAGRLACCDAYVGNDSGLTHVAAALGGPTLAIFGPTSPATWRPPGGHVEVIQSRTDGRWEWPEVASVLHGVCRLLGRSDRRL